MGNSDWPPSDVIARRELDVRGSAEKVIVELARPYKRPTSEFACPYRIECGKTVIQREIFGVDAFQALQLGLKMIAVNLHHDDRLPIGQMYLFEPDAGIGFDDPEVRA